MEVSIKFELLIFNSKYTFFIYREEDFHRYMWSNLKKYSGDDKLPIDDVEFQILLVNYYLNFL